MNLIPDKGMHIGNSRLKILFQSLYILFQSSCFIGRNGKIMVVLWNSGMNMAERRIKKEELNLA